MRQGRRTGAISSFPGKGARAWEQGLRFQNYKDTKTKKERLSRTDGYPSLAISRINDHERRTGAIFFGRYRPNNQLLRCDGTRCAQSNSARQRTAQGFRVSKENLFADLAGFGRSQSVWRKLQRVLAWTDDAARSYLPCPRLSVDGELEGLLNELSNGVSVFQGRNVGCAHEGNTNCVGEECCSRRDNADRTVFHLPSRIHHKLRDDEAVNAGGKKARGKTQLKQPRGIESGSAINLIRIENRDARDEILEIH